MAQSAANPPLSDTADAISNAVITPKISLFVREILEKALTNPVGVAPRWAADAWALLANVLMNDYLNWWNYAGEEELRKADDAAHNALALNPKLGFAHHARGLVYRARRQHKLALKAFRKAKHADGGFARGHAQFGNQKVLLGRESEAHDPIAKARSLAPNHPASGYFAWGDGRAYFQETVSGSNTDWSKAIVPLKKSVCALPTVWYNRCYLATAQNKAGDPVDAKATMDEFINCFGRPVLRRAVTSLQDNPTDPQPVRDARAAVLAYISQF
jgi:tetratricopeptide (TPR) repeat protein